jgi:type I restriction enzyme, S subunit
MGSEWVQSSLGETCYITDGAHAKVERQSEGVLYLTSKNIGEGNLKLDSFDYISEQDFERLFTDTKKSQRRLRDGDILTGIIGTFGNAYRYKEDDHFGISSSVAILRPNQTLLDSDFLYYAITSRSFKATVEAYKGGSVQGYTNIATLKTLPIPLPDLSSQKRMAEILGSLDNKIALNRQINTTLESMAQALFKSWFVDFDPVIDNALAAGHDIPDELQARAARRRALRGSDSEGESNAETRTHPQGPTHPADVQQHFPDRFVFTEDMGWVPEGWEVVTLKEMTQKIGSGATPRGGQSVYQESGISLIRSQNIYDSDFVWDGLAFITDEAALQLKNVEVMEGDVLINITGASILRTCIVEPSVLPARVNQHVAIIRPKSGVPSRYLHLHLLNQKIKNHLMAQNAGASREAVTKGHLEVVPVLQPDSKVLSFFERYTVGMTDKSLACGASSKTLVDLRDSLLPKLLSGQITIPDAEQVLDEVL